MAGPKTIYNSTGMECLLDLLIREQGVVFSPDFMTIDDPVCTATECTTMLRGAETSETTGTSLHYGSAPFSYSKYDLLARLPPDIVFSATYPCTPEDFYIGLASTYDLRFEPGDLSVVTGSAEVPLDNIPILGTAPDVKNRIQLRTRNTSRRWVGGKSFSIYIADPSVASWTPLTLTGDAPNAAASADYRYQYTVDGGQGPYTYAIVSGIAPAALNPLTGAFMGTITAAGNLSWVVRVTDSRNLTYDLADSAVISTVPLAITTTSLPNGKVGVPYSHQITAQGGALGHKFSLRSTDAVGLSITQDGLLSGTLDAGRFNLVVRVTDNASSYVDQPLVLTIAARSNHELAVSLLGKTMLWYDFTESDFHDGAVLEAVYVRPGGDGALTVNGQVVAADGTVDGALELIDGYLTGEQDQYDNFATLLTYQTPTLQRGVGLMGRATSALGWEVFHDSAENDVVEFGCVINTQRYAIRTDGSFNLYGPDFHTVIAQRVGTHMALSWDDTIIGTAVVPDKPLMRTRSVPMTIGKRLSMGNGPNLKAVIDRLVFFRDRIWTDEMTYLHNNGLGRRYLDLTADAQ